MYTLAHPLYGYQKSELFVKTCAAKALLLGFLREISFAFNFICDLIINNYFRKISFLEHTRTNHICLPNVCD
jgi:hypothetical protein